MLVVVEPGRRSLETAHRVRQMAGDLGIRRFGVVMNKSAAPDEDAGWVAGEFGPGVLLGVIPWDSRIAQADRDGRSLPDLGQPDLMVPFQKILHTLDSLSKEKTK